MQRVDAKAVMAEVPHYAVQLVVVDTEGHRERKAMCVVGHFASALMPRPPELPVNLPGASGPSPAGLAHLDLRPEAVCHGQAGTIH